MFKDLNPPNPITRPQDSPDWQGTDSPKPSPSGLGDRVERIAQPIARVIDSLAGTNIQQCGGCKKRREALNKAFPLN